jgi:transposase
MADGRCAGVDWAKDTHDVVVQDPDGAEVWAAAVPHSETGLERLTSSLVRLGVTRVAIERPDGLLVERLLDAGLAVIPMHPNQVAAARPSGVSRN